MTINCRKWKSFRDRERYERRVLVDGEEIRLVWYVDVRRGIVKTYDLGDNVAHASMGFNRSRYPADWFIEEERGGAVSRVLRGKVSLLPR